MADHQTGDDLVQLNIDLVSGKIELRAPLQHVSALLGEVKEFLPHLAEASGASVSRRSLDAEAPSAQASVQQSEQTLPKPKRAKRKPSASKTEKSAQGLGSWKYADFTPIDLGIGDEKEMELASLYQEKSPSNNYEKTAVALWALSKITGDNEFNYDQIFQAMRLAKEAKSPSNLSEAVGKLVNDNFAAKGEAAVRLKIQGTDWVENELPKKD